MTFQKHYATPETRRKTLKRHRQFTNTKLTFRLKTLCHPGSPTRNAKTTTLSVYQYKMTFQKHYAMAESQRETLKERPRLFNNTKLTFRPKTLCHAGNPTRNAKTTTLSVSQYKMTSRPKTLCHAGKPARNAKTTTSSVYQ